MAAALQSLLERHHTHALIELFFRECLNAVAQELPGVADVLGLGPVLGTELTRDTHLSPGSEAISDMLPPRHDRGAGLHGNVVRNLTSLTVPLAQLDRGADIYIEELTRRAG